MASIFRKSLSDMVKGLRSLKSNEAAYVSQCLAEIKEELKSTDKFLKVIAIQKLTYLNMLGYDMAWAAFHVVEVMSYPRFAHKHVGYMAASRSFHEGTEVIMLTTNLIKKDLGASNMYEAGLAIDCLANICTSDLARDLVNDVAAMLNSSKPYIRKKTVLLMYKIFLQFPEALRPSFPRLRERLDDTDPSVVCAAVNVICELARKNANNYLALAPVFFNILTSSNNNWMLIKIVKLFAALTPHEPRLAKKLVDPLTNIINTTPAKSLLYECIQTAIIGCSHHMPLVRLCLEKLKLFVEDTDQNLKYLGLLGLSRVMQAHPKTVAEYKDLVLQCLDDEDITIRRRALDLISGMVMKKTLHDIVARILSNIPAAEGTYRDDLVAKIVEICSRDNYTAISSFQWYVGVLVELARVKSTIHGELIASQFLDVMVRVRSVRRFGVYNMAQLLAESDENIATEVLYAAAWIAGEYPDQLSNPASVIDYLLQPRSALLPANIQATYMQNALKIWLHCAASTAGSGASTLLDVSAGGELDLEAQGAVPKEPVKQDHSASESLRRIRDSVNARLPLFAQSVHVEVQERAVFFTQLLVLYDQEIQRGNNISLELSAMFKEELHPVAPKAQRKVPVPKGLDLDAVINYVPEPSSRASDDDDDDMYAGSEKGKTRRRRRKERFSFSSNADDNDDLLGGSGHHGSGGGGGGGGGGMEREPTPEELERRRKEREQRMAARAHDPFYLFGATGSGGGGSGGSNVFREGDVDNIPIVALSKEDVGEPIEVGRRGRGGKKSGKSRRGRRGEEFDDDDDEPVVISTTFAMPENAVDSDDEKNNSSKGKMDLGMIDITKPLGYDERLPQAETYAERNRKTTVSAAPVAAAHPAAAAMAPAVDDGDKKHHRRKHRSHKDGSARGEPPQQQSTPVSTSNNVSSSLIDLDISYVNMSNNSNANVTNTSNVAPSANAGGGFFESFDEPASTMMVEPEAEAEAEPEPEGGEKKERSHRHRHHHKRSSKHH